MHVPVAMLAFNRPDETRRVLERVRRAKPSKLFVVADGPRPEIPGETELCSETRGLFTSIDWCEVRTHFATENMGCRKRISSGLQWIFEQVPEAIILEDDCLPDQTFFPFCEELLERYRTDSRIMAISGDNFQFGHRRTSDSYYFSRYLHVWGWASWQRAWKHYDETIQLWPSLREGKWLNDILGDRRAVDYWTRIYQDVYDGRIDTWDYQWQLAVWVQSGLVALPNQNLVTNIGFAARATHTVENTPMADLPAVPLEFPLKHPSYIIRDAAADKATQQNLYSPNLPQRIRHRLRGALVI